MIKKQGSIMFSLLVIIGLIMATVASFTTQAVLLYQSSKNQAQSDQAYLIASSVVNNAVQHYMRYGAGMINPYPDWVTGCLQETGWVCKMELDLDDSGGLINSWGQYQQKIRHLQAQISVDASGVIEVSSINELYD